MKSPHLALVALSLSVAATAACAQTTATGTTVQPTQQAQPARTAERAPVERARRNDANECVGPASFCNIYFGS
jgi:curli biogenesis system outer membrane secretion channel CsgG